MVQTWSKHGPKWSNMVRHRLKLGSSMVLVQKWSKNSPKMVPKNGPYGPKWSLSKNGPKMIQYGPKSSKTWFPSASGRWESIQFGRVGVGTASAGSAARVPQVYRYRPRPPTLIDVCICSQNAFVFQTSISDSARGTDGYTRVRFRSVPGTFC